jgi:hypothetical protein
MSLGRWSETHKVWRANRTQLAINPEVTPMTNNTFTTNERHDEIKLTPIFMQTRGRAISTEEPAILVNADEIVRDILSGGHPNGERLVNDYVSAIHRVLSATPQMPVYLAKHEAITDLLASLYDIRWEADEDGVECIPV